MNISDASTAIDNSLAEVVDDVSNLMLLGSPHGSRLTDVGVGLLAGEAPASTHVVWVTLRQTPSDVVDRWDDSVGERPAAFTVVTVGDELADGDDAAVATDSVAAPSNLTQLGMTLTEVLSASSDAERLGLRFDSLTPLLQYVDRQAAFQFLHALTTKVAANDATAHFQLDPAAVDDRTVETLTSVCDARVVVDDEVTVQYR